MATAFPSCCSGQQTQSLHCSLMDFKLHGHRQLPVPMFRQHWSRHWHHFWNFTAWRHQWNPESLTGTKESDLFHTILWRENTTWTGQFNKFRARGSLHVLKATNSQPLHNKQHCQKKRREIILQFSLFYRHSGTSFGKVYMQTAARKECIQNTIRRSQCSVALKLW